MLPNEKYTKKVLKRVISANNEWAVYLISVENFQPYKDVYTELAGDKVVQALIAIIKSSISETDFLSRVGDNEFILMTHPSSAEQLASFIGFAFDTVVPKFYSNDDATRGYMLLQGDEIAGIRIPFMALCPAVLKGTCPSLGGHHLSWSPDCFQFTSASEGQPVCSFTSSVFVEPPGSLGGGE